MSSSGREEPKAAVRYLLLILAPSPPTSFCPPHHTTLRDFCLSVGTQHIYITAKHAAYSVVPQKVDFLLKGVATFLSLFFAVLVGCDCTF